MAVAVVTGSRHTRRAMMASSVQLSNYCLMPAPLALITQQDVALKCVSGHFSKIMPVHSGNSSLHLGLFYSATSNSEEWKVPDHSPETLGVPFAESLARR
jgi:hypothetical protein